MKRVAILKSICAVFALCTVTSVLARAQTYSDLHDFDGTSGGYTNWPGVLAQGRDGNLYGTSQSSTPYNMGIVFKMTVSGAFEPLDIFDGTNGSEPGGLTLGTNGNLFGTTVMGGGTGCALLGCGTVFEVTPKGNLTTIYSFSISNGGPISPPVLGGDDNFYGTAYFTPGTAYKITPSGNLSELAILSYFPYASPFYASDGNFYGTTYTGGSQGTCGEGCGTVYKMTPQGTVTTLRQL